MRWLRSCFRLTFNLRLQLGLNAFFIFAKCLVFDEILFSRKSSLSWQSSKCFHSPANHKKIHVFFTKIITKNCQNSKFFQAAWRIRSCLTQISQKLSRTQIFSFAKTNPGVQKWPTTFEKIKKLHVSKCWNSPLRAEGFFVSLEILYGGLGIGNCNFWSQKK